MNVQFPTLSDLSIKNLTQTNLGLSQCVILILKRQFSADAKLS